MPSYRVKPGYTHGVFNQYKAGDVVALTKEEAAGFLDKLVLIGESQPYTVPTGNLVAGGLLVTPDAFAKAQAAAKANEEIDIDLDAIPDDVDHVEFPDGSTLDRTEDDAPPVEFDVAGATVEAVLAAVKDGKITADAALIAEQQGKKRTSLLSELTKLVEAESKPQE